MDLSIIIVNYNTSDMVIDCVNSIRDVSRKSSYEIIVVDNNSEEKQKEKLRGFPGILFIELASNLGFGRANNEGAKKAKGDMLFFLNPDTVLICDAPSILYDYMIKHDKVGICGGNLFDKEMRPAHSFHVMFPSILSELDFAFNQRYRRMRYGKNIQFNYTSTPIEVAMITGADLMIRRNVWYEIGGFASEYFMYCEDAELCFQATRLGYRVVNVPESKIIHLEGASFLENEVHCKRVLDGRFVYFRKNYSCIYNIIADSFNVISLTCAVLIYKIMRNRNKEYNYKLRLKTYIKCLREKK